MTMSPDLAAFITTRVGSGSYPSEEAVLRAAFQLLEQREDLLRRIEKGAAELSRGEYREYTIDDRDQLISDVQDTIRMRNESRRAS